MLNAIEKFKVAILHMNRDGNHWYGCLCYACMWWNKTNRLAVYSYLTRYPNRFNQPSYKCRGMLENSYINLQWDWPNTFSQLMRTTQPIHPAMSGLTGSDVCSGGGEADNEFSISPKDFQFQIFVCFSPSLDHKIHKLLTTCHLIDPQYFHA